MKDRRYSLVIIVLLLVIFLPLTIAGYIYKENNKIEENPNHEFYYQGKIWFYDRNDNYISKYECLTEICEFAKSSINDDEYNINYFKDGTLEDISIISNSYVFIQDGDIINLFDINHGQVIQGYKAIKNYNTNLSDSVYILDNNNDLWGVLYVKDVLNLIIPFDYNFIGLKDNLDDNGALIANKYIVLKDTEWYIIDDKNHELTNKFNDPIVDYTDKYIITKDNGKFKIYNYQGNQYLTYLEIDNYLVEKNYIGIISDNILYIYNNLENDYIKITNLAGRVGNITLKQNNNILNILENDSVIDSLS